MRERARQAWWAAGAAVAMLCVALLLAACTGDSSARTSAGTPAAARGSATPGGGQGTPGAQRTPVIGVTPVDGGVGVAGPSGDVCQQPAHVAAALPASIPAYPNGDLRLAEQAQGVAFFGVCAADGPATVAQFYAAQLPAKGWGQLQSSAIDSTQILTAAQGDAHVVVTIQPDPLVAGKTQIVIQATGV